MYVQMRLTVSPSVQSVFTVVWMQAIVLNMTCTPLVHTHMYNTSHTHMYNTSHTHMHKHCTTHLYTHTHTHTHICTQEPFIVECVNFVASRAPKPITAGTVLTQEMVVVILSCIQPFVRFVSTYECIAT